MKNIYVGNVFCTVIIKILLTGAKIYWQINGLVTGKVI